MGRSYHLSKKIAENQAMEILMEINGFSDIKQAAFSSGMDYLEIGAKGHDYSEIMSRAVNLFSKKADGCELSFARFV